MTSNLKHYRDIVKAYNLKLERWSHPDYPFMQYKIVTSTDGRMAALMKIEPMGTPFYGYDFTERILLREWCHETFVDDADECYNGVREDFDIMKYLDTDSKHGAKSNDETPTDGVGGRVPGQWGL